MNYIWTEDTGAGLHYWQLLNEHVFCGSFMIESKGSNQGILDAVRELAPAEGDKYYLAFDIVYDNMDILNKYLELKVLAAVYPEQIIILDMICFEHIILSFVKLAEWTGTGKTDKIAMRDIILSSMKGHKIVIDNITDTRIRNYLQGFKKYSTERVLKAITYELTENEQWTVKGRYMGACWWQDCCMAQNAERVKCGITNQQTGDSKIRELLKDTETKRIIKDIGVVCQP